ncbi:MAG: N(G),N(G)-dimethylarginine dimethylaminohydrolase [Pseudomonadota bacterium]
MFTHAIVRPPNASLTQALTTSSALGEPDPALAARQHQAYVDALARCGVEVRSLGPAPEFPDSPFVEDTALLTPRGAVTTRPGAPSRRSEAALNRSAIEGYFDEIYAIEAPGTLDAGDVMMVRDHYYIGLSGRTNGEGARQLGAILNRWGYEASTVALADGLHLKSSVSYLEHGHLLITEALASHPAFAPFTRVLVPEEEMYAANALWVNETLLVAEGFARTLARVRDALTLPIITLAMSEFEKVDGGLSCLSLRFRPTRRSA